MGIAHLADELPFETGVKDADLRLPHTPRKVLAQQLVLLVQLVALGVCLERVLSRLLGDTECVSRVAMAADHRAVIVSLLVGHGCAYGVNC